MSKISNSIQEIQTEALYRSSEIKSLFERLSSFDSKFLDSNGNILDTFKDSDGNSLITLLDKVHIARSVIVFSYANIEKYVKSLSQHALTAIVDNNYYVNHTKELFCIVKYLNKPDKLFDIVYHYKTNSQEDFNYEFVKDKGHFSRRDRVDSSMIAYIVKVLDLDSNDSLPMLRIPKITLDNLSKKRMDLAHGDYLNDLKKYNSERCTDLKLEDINNYIYDVLLIREKTETDLINFIKDFKEKIILLLHEIERYEILQAN